eukprot:scaffold148651_cov31-Tisochrysis_lutea.AAC.13
MASLPFRSGSSTGTRRSNRPGRSSAGSSMSARFVAAITCVGGARSNDPWRRLCGAHDDTGVPVETVHLGQDLIERLLALVASTSHPTACAGPRACNRIDFVDEDDAGRILLGLRPECDGQ